MACSSARRMLKNVRDGGTLWCREDWLRDCGVGWDVFGGGVGYDWEARDGYHRL